MSPRRRQTEQRFRRRLEVRYGVEGQRFQIGFSGNISNTGMMVRTPHVLAPGTILRLELRLAQEALLLTGLVVWARTGPLTWLATGRIGMGIRFIDPPDDLVATLRSEAPARAS